MRALCMIRHALVYRREVFVEGLKAAGYKVVEKLDDPGPEDLLVTWNRYGTGDDAATRFERAKAKVIVCENGYLGKNWLGTTWIAMSQNHHAGAGFWHEGSGDRWDNLHVKLKPFRTGGTELVILGQRGIGEPGIASPDNWHNLMQRRHGGRIRYHPGNANGPDLEADLAYAHSVMTWHSGAALKALMSGIPVWYGFDKWIGAKAGLPVEQYNEKKPKRDDADRLAMFRRLAWAQWNLDTEVKDGTAFKYLLRPKPMDFVTTGLESFV